MATLQCASLARAAHTRCTSDEGGSDERATALLRALPACALHGHAAALNKLVRRQCRDDAELAAALAARAAKAAAGLPRSLTPAARLALLRWTLMAAEASKDDKTWEHVLAAHMTLLSQLHGDGEAVAARSSSSQAQGARPHPRGGARTWRAAAACRGRGLPAAADGLFSLATAATHDVRCAAATTADAARSTAGRFQPERRHFCPPTLRSSSSVPAERPVLDTAKR